jgi:pectate lyase
MKTAKIGILCLFALFSLRTARSAGPALAAFPGAEGFGRNAVGGRGGRVIEVTNLNDSGPGSLRAAIDARGPRIVVFRVGGYIELKSMLDVNSPYITIAGQTAPGDGICLKNYGLAVHADNVIIRYLRVRPSDITKQEFDSISILNGRNIIVDHCSASWALDEVISVVSRRPTLGDVTVQWCMITESLNCSAHRKGCHGYASLIRAAFGNGVSYHHNLYAHNNGRNPRPGNYVRQSIDPCGLIFDFRNNVIYNWGGKHAGYNDDGKNEANSITKMNFVNNYYIKGSNSTGGYAFRDTTATAKAYFAGNWMDGNCPKDPWSLVEFVDFTQAQKDAYKQASQRPVGQVTTDDAPTAYTVVLADAGAVFPVRDAVDKRVLDSVIKKTGRIINHIGEVGGYPPLATGTPPVDSDHDGMPDKWELAVGLNPSDANDAHCDRDRDGYTNIEEYINWLPLGKPMPAKTADVTRRHFITS